MGNMKEENMPIKNNSEKTQHLTEDEIKLWCRGRLEPGKEKEFLEHVNSCDECMERWMDFMEEHKEYQVEVPANLKSGILNEVGKKKESKFRKRLIPAYAAAAAVLAILILPNTSADIANAMSRIPVIGGLVKVVTFRDYTYDDGKNHADIEVPELTADTEKMEKTAEEIDKEIKEITDGLISEFEESLKNDGYQSVHVDSEVLCTTEDYFTLRLNCEQVMGSGAQWQYFYTIDLNTGKRVSLSDLFKEGSDYKKAVSEDIKRQMKNK